MALIPPLPTWDTAHPIVVHFPIGLLAIAPVFIVLSMLWGSRHREMLTSALVLVLLGTAGAMLATATGEAGERWAKGVPGVDKLVHEHEEAGELARNLFIGVTAVMLIACAVAWMRSKPMALGARWLMGAILLGVYTYPALALMEAGHLGGRLVHDHKVTVPLTAARAAADANPRAPGATPPARTGEADPDDDER